jgi:hypothetical protein
VCRGMPRCPWDVCGGGPGAGLVGFLWGHAEGLRRPTWLDLTDLGPRPSGGRFALEPGVVGGSSSARAVVLADLLGEGDPRARWRGGAPGAGADVAASAGVRCRS